MIRTIPFTSHANYSGSAPYFAMPAPQPPSTRSPFWSGITGTPGGVASPAPGRNTAYKAGVNPQLTGYQSTALTPQGPVNYQSPGTGFIRS